MSQAVYPGGLSLDEDKRLNSLDLLTLRECWNSK